MSESLSMWRDHKLHSAVEREFLMQVSELNRLRNLISHLRAEKLLLTEDETRAIAQRNVLKRAMDNQKQLDHIADRVETWNNSPLKEERGGDKKTDSNNNQSNEAEKVNGKKQNATSILKISLNEKKKIECVTYTKWWTTISYATTTTTTATKQCTSNSTSFTCSKRCGDKRCC